jgi:hypothetical protein
LDLPDNFISVVTKRFKYYLVPSNRPRLQTARRYNPSS